MRFVEAKIDGFGRYRNERIKMNAGFSVFCGPNESGKTTLLKFIEGVLYGFFEDETSDRKTADFERYRPWDGGSYAGTLIYEHKGKQIEIFRDFDKNVVKVKDHKTGKDISGRVNYNEKIGCIEPAGLDFGVSAAAFRNTFSIAQGQMSPQMMDIQEEMSRALLSNDGTVSVERSLSGVRKRLAELEGDGEHRENRIEALQAKEKELTEKLRCLGAFREEKKALRELLAGGVAVAQAKRTPKWLALLLVILAIVSLAAGVALGLALDPMLLTIIADSAICLGVFVLLARRDMKQKDLAAEQTRKCYTDREALKDRLFELESQGDEEALTAELLRVGSEREKLEMERDSLRSTVSAMQKLSADVRKSYTPQISRSLAGAVTAMTEGRYKTVYALEGEGIRTETKDGKEISIDQVSAGTGDQIAFALRLALMDVFSPKVKLPIMLDDAFARYDGQRLEKVLLYLSEQRADRQILILSCQTREQEILEKHKIPFEKLVLGKAEK